MKRAIGIAVVVLGLGALAWVFWPEGDPPPNAGATTAKIRRGNIVVDVSASGLVEANVQVDVKSRASGVVAELPVRPGDHVDAGQLLVKLDPTDEERGVREAEVAEVSARARLAQAQAGLAAARADSGQAAEKAARRAEALSKGLVSSEDEATARGSALVAAQQVTLRQAEIRAARAELERASLAIAEAHRRLDETVIRAPMSGTVLAVAVQQGATVSSGTTTVGGGTSLLTLADLSKLRVIAKIDEAQVGQVKSGQVAKLRVDAFPDRAFTGSVERVHPLGTTVSNVVTFDVEVAVTDPNASMLMPGMTADVEIEAARENDVLLLPLAALRSERRERFVLLASGERRPVRTGATDGIDVVVVEGLAEGQEVLVAGRPAAGAPDKKGGLGDMFRPRGPGGGGRPR